MTQGRELAVGSTVIAAILVVVVGTLWLQGTNWGRGATYVEVLVLDVGQLTAGNPVKLRGVSIGRVASITVDPGGDVVRLGLEVEGAFDLGNPVSAGVIIAPQSLFGDWQAEIVRRARFPQFDYFDVPATDQGRDTLVIGGYAIPDISRLTAAADEISQNLSVLTGRFDRAFDEQTVDQFRSVIANLAVVSSEARDLISQQASTIEEVSADVARAAEQISQATAQANATFRGGRRNPPSRRRGFHSSERANRFRQYRPHRRSGEPIGSGPRPDRGQGGFDVRQRSTPHLPDGIGAGGVGTPAGGLHAGGARRERDGATRLASRRHQGQSTALRAPLDLLTGEFRTELDQLPLRRLPRLSAQRAVREERSAGGVKLSQP